MIAGSDCVEATCRGLHGEARDYIGRKETGYGVWNFVGRQRLARHSFPGHSRVHQVDYTVAGSANEHRDGALS